MLSSRQIRNNFDSNILPRLCKHSINNFLPLEYYLFVRSPPTGWNDIWQNSSLWVKKNWPRNCLNNTKLHGRCNFCLREWSFIFSPPFSFPNIIEITQKFAKKCGSSSQKLILFCDGRLRNGGGGIFHFWGIIFGGGYFGGIFFGGFNQKLWAEFDDANGLPSVVGTICAEHTSA